MSAPPPPPPGAADNAGPPSSPRSPRPPPSSTADSNPNSGPARGGIVSSIAVPPGGGGSFVIPPELQSTGGVPPRPNISSMLFMTAFFFFMSGGNHYPTPGVEVGPDGELKMRMSYLEYSRLLRDEWRSNLNGTALEMNYTEPAVPEILPSSLIPSEYIHTVHSDTYHRYSSDLEFYTNITGFYRSATVHPLSLSSAPSSSGSSSDQYWRHITHLPSLNSTGEWNETLAEELRGSWSWANTVRWDMNLRERNVSLPHNSVMASHKANGTEPEQYEDWSWVKGSVMLTSSPALKSSGERYTEGGEMSKNEKETIDYNFYGLHYKPNGTYNLYGLPEGMRVDIRHVPGLWGRNWDHPADAKDGSVARVTREIILRELEKEVRTEEDMLLLNDLRDDDVSEVTTCPLLIHLTLPPLPPGLTQEDVEAYENEMRDPSGILSSLYRPPAYWQSGVGLGAVFVADGCGWAMGVDDGKGMTFEDFWNRNINYALYASISQLLVLTLLVRQMEITRTPSALAKVSTYMIVIMAITDSWIFSAHVVLGIVSDTRASLPMLIPGFMCLCTAVIFGPRYAVMLHRVQAPERVSAPAITTTLRGTSQANGENDNESTVTGDSGATSAAVSVQRRIGRAWDGARSFFVTHPGFKWLTIVGLIFCFIQFAFLPSITPVMITVVYSFWVPQIWRNARRGTSGVDGWFICGTTAGRLALPLYVFAYADNIFFVEKVGWVWAIVSWQLFQVAVLFAQERFGPAFFLPKSLAPPESYNYHPLLPSADSDPEASHPLLLLSADADGEKTCSICMEEVDLSQSHPTSRSRSSAGLSSLAAGVSVGVGAGDKRRAYALAPCGHLFHTKCLSQWMAIKTICPLCKRSLPPL